MSGRNWFKDGSSMSPGMVYGNFGFRTQPTANQPVDYTQAFGMGGLTGTDSSSNANVNSGPAAIASIVRTANTGQYLVTMVDGFRKVWGLDGNLAALPAGIADGSWVQCHEPLNEGAGRTTPITFLITTLSSANTPTDFTGRLVEITLAMKDSGAGA